MTTVSGHGLGISITGAGLRKAKGKGVHPRDAIWAPFAIEASKTIWFRKRPHLERTDKARKN